MTANIARQGAPLKKRLLAAALELVPLLAFGTVWNGPIPLTVALVLASGLGWWLLGRWDIAMLVWIARFFLVFVVFGVIGFVLWGYADCTGCAAWPAYLIAAIMIGVYVAMTVVSAYFVAMSRQPA